MSKYQALVHDERYGDIYHTGWIPPLPDIRDYKSPTPIFQGQAESPSKKDLRLHCSPVEDQGPLGSCTGHAAVGLLEYCERRAHGRHVEASRLFVYKMARWLAGTTGDTGAYLRNALGALVLFGAPPEKYWPYRVERFDWQPEAAVFALADNYEALQYVRHDTPTRQDTVNRLRLYMNLGLPSVGGFYGFPSAGNGNFSGAIPRPGPRERVTWGHAVLFVGYDDNLMIENRKYPESTTEGAFLFQNSWGKYWGLNGYGWLPYWYVEQRCALDFWSLMRAEWTDLSAFDAT